MDLRPLIMADVTVAFDAGKNVAARFMREHILHKIAVAIKTSILRHPRIAGFDLNRLMKIPGCKGKRMKESVVCFGDPLSQKIMGKVAIIAGRHILMAGF